MHNGGGGAITVAGLHTIDIARSQLEANEAGLGGGAIETGSLLATVTESLLSDNQAGPAAVPSPQMDRW